MFGDAQIWVYWVKDFAPLTTLYNSEQVLTVAPSLPARSLKELIALAKAKPDELNYATVGSGGTTHIVSELLNMMAEVPTFAEAGLPGFEGTIWFCVQAHGATPRAIVNRLSADISRIIMRPDISEALVQQATQPYVMTPEAFAARIRSDAEIYARVIKAANMKFE